MARILVVDDDHDVLRVVEKVLNTRPHDVVTAENAVEAMEYLDASSFDVLITDARMPSFSGFELVQTLKNNNRYARLAIAMLTGLREKKDIEKAIRAGVDDYIVKPIDPTLLLQKVDQLLVKKPPIENSEISFPENSSFAVSQLSFEGRVVYLSETGLTVISRMDLPSGFRISLHTDLFNKIGVTQPHMKVVNCKKLDDYKYEINVEFLNQSEHFKQKVRSWILSHVNPATKKGVA